MNFFLWVLSQCRRKSFCMMRWGPTLEILLLTETSIAREQTWKWNFSLWMRQVGSFKCLSHFVTQHILPCDELSCQVLRASFGTLGNVKCVKRTSIWNASFAFRISVGRLNDSIRLSLNFWCFFLEFCCWEKLCFQFLLLNDFFV